MLRTAAVATFVGVMVISAVAGAVTVEGVATDRQAAPEPDGSLSSNDTHWHGQKLALEIPQADAGTVYQIRHVTEEGQVGSLATEFVVDANREAVIDTRRFRTGEYVVVSRNKTPLRINDDGRVVGTATVEAASWEIARQTFSVSPSERRTLPGGTVEFDLQSNRGRYPLVISSPGLDTLTLEQAVDGTSVDVDGDGESDGVRVAATAFDTLPMQIPDDVASGNYTLRFFAADTSANDTAVLRIQEELAGGASFVDAVVQTDRGDIASINVQLADTDTATVAITSEDTDYAAAVTVTDGTGTGSVTIRMNTYLAGRVEDERLAYGVANSEDSIDDVRRESSQRDTPLPAADYQLRAYVDQELTDRSLLALAGRSTQGVDIATAPQEGLSSGSPRIISLATFRDQIALGDKLIVNVDASGFTGFVDESYDFTPGSASAREHGASIQIHPVDGSQEPINLSTAQVHLDPANDALFLIVDTAGRSFNRGQTYNARFVLDDRNPYVPDGQQEVVNETFTFTERRATVDGVEDGTLTIVPDPDVRINGNTTIAPTSELLITLRSPDQGIILDDTTSVQQSGSWTIGFSPQDIPEDQNITLQVRDDTGVISDDIDVNIEEPETPEPDDDAGQDDQSDDEEEDEGASNLQVAIGGLLVLILLAGWLWYIWP